MKLRRKKLNEFTSCVFELVKNDWNKNTLLIMVCIAIKGIICISFNVYIATICTLKSCCVKAHEIMKLKLLIYLTSITYYVYECLHIFNYNREKNTNYF